MKFCWTSLVVKDLEKSIKFYTEIVGLALDRRFKPNELMEIAFLGKAPTKLELIQDESAQASSAEGISVGFIIEGKLEEVMHKLNDQGFTEQSEVHSPSPSMRFVYVKDPDGFLVQFVEAAEGNVL